MTNNKFIISIILSIALFYILFWFVFYSAVAANNSFIIQARNLYFTQLDKVTPRSWFIYRLRPIKKTDDNVFTYKFPGRFQKIDFEKSTITLTDLNNKNRTFKYYTNKPETGISSDYESIDYRYVIVKKDKSIENKLLKMSINKLSPSDTFLHFSEGDVIVLYWNDTRTMTQINDSFDKNETIELKGAKIIQINKVVWE